MRSASCLFPPVGLSDSVAPLRPYSVHSPFCVVFLMIVSWAIDVGGALPMSARNAVHASFFDVARIRAEPLLKEPPLRFELIEIPAALLVPKITVAAGATLSEVAAA